jgi:epoxyqueuosine reductase
VGAREETIAAEARAIGFARAGCAALGPLPRAPFMAAWLADGRAGDMTYLPKRAAERLDARHAFPWARALVSLAYPYRPPPPPAEDWRTGLFGRIAAYARGADYHDHVLELCERLSTRLAARFYQDLIRINIRGFNQEFACSLVNTAQRFDTVHDQIEHYLL